MGTSLRGSVILATLILVVSSVATLAADNKADVLEEVVVTAQKREQNLQDVPISMSAVTEKSIEQLGIQDFRQWANYVPGVQVSYGLNSRRGGPIAVIRGVTNQVRGGLGDNTANSTSAYTIGEIPVFSVSPAMTDMQRIEVLRGPQGTLFGIAAMGGVIRYIPNDADTHQYFAKFGAGSGLIQHGSSVANADAVINLPLVEGVLGVRFSGAYQWNGGFIDHIYPRLDQTQNLDPASHIGFDPRDRFGQYEEDTNDMEVMGARIAVTYTPTENLSVRLASMRNETTMGDAWQVDLNDSLDLVTNRFVKREQRSEFELHDVKIGYGFDFGTVEYIAGYYTNHLGEVVDATKFMGDQLVDLQGLPFPSAASFPFLTDTRQTTHEFRIVGQAIPLATLSNTKLAFDYVVGGFYQNERRSGVYRIGSPEWNMNLPTGAPASAYIMTENGLRSGASGGSEYKNKAAFVDLTVHVGERLSVAGGARWFEQEKTDWGRGWGDWTDLAGVRQPDDLNNVYFRPSDNPAIPGYDASEGGYPRLTTSSIDNDGMTPRFSIQYNLTDDKMLYFTVSKGERIGTSPPDTRSEEQITEGWTPTCEATIREYGLLEMIKRGTASDSLTTYDVGLKSLWLDRRLLLNLSAYYTDWSDLQQVVIVNSINRECSQVIQGNVGAAEIKGFELESTFSLTDNWTLNGSVAFADAKISDAPPGVIDSIGQPLQKGDALQSVPPWSGNVGLQYEFRVPVLPGDFTGYIRADWRYVGERIKGFGDKASLRAAIPLNVADSYSLTDIRFGVDNASWSATAYVSNVFDERAQFEAMSNFFQPLIKEVAISQPRTVGFTISKTFN